MSLLSKSGASIPPPARERNTCLAAAPIEAQGPLSFPALQPVRLGPSWPRRQIFSGPCDWTFTFQSLEGLFSVSAAIRT